MVDMLDEVAPLAPKRPRIALLKHINQLEVKILLQSKVEKINNDGIEIIKNEEHVILNGFDAIILAFGSKPNQVLYNQIKELNHIHVIGDASIAGDAKKAIFEATELALKL